MLGGMRLKNFSVKSARLYLCESDIIIPNWSFNDMATIEITEKTWKNAWLALNWRFRPNPHYSAYWRVLHNRALLAWEPPPKTLPQPPINTTLRSDANSPPGPSTSTISSLEQQQINPQGERANETDPEDYYTPNPSTLDSPSDHSVTANFPNRTPIYTDADPTDENYLSSRKWFIADPTNQPARPHWAIDKCNICGAKDSTSHGFFLCPPIQQLWKDALSLLPSLLQDHKVVPLEHANLSLRNVVLGFPDLIASLPRHKRNRVVLWHSAVIYVITQARTKSIWKSRKYGIRTVFNWGPNGSETLSKIKFEIRNLFWSIYISSCQSGDLNAIRAFENQWCTENAWCSIQYNDNNEKCILKFHQ
jgi:hypothetical protein